MNPILQKLHDNTLAHYAKIKPVLLKAEQAGMKVMYAPQTRQMMARQLGANPSDPEAIGAGIAKLLGILYAESKKTLPPPVFGPLSILLLCDGLDFLEEAGKVKVTPQFVNACTQATGSAVLQLLGVNPDKLSEMLHQAAAAKQGGAGAAPGGGMPAAPPPAGIVGQAVGAQ